MLVNNFTRVQQEIIGILAEIEKADGDECSKCGGEDCVCCPIYIDRQKWVSPGDMFDPNY